MPAVVIIIVVVAVVVIVALVVTNPMMRRREDEAIAAVKRELGGTDLIEPRATAMGTDPEDAGGIRGMACLGMNAGELLAVTWVGSASWRIPRAAVVSVESPVDDPSTVPKATVTITYAHEDGEATAMFRLRDAGEWLAALGTGLAGTDSTGPVVDAEPGFDDEGGFDDEPAVGFDDAGDPLAVEDVRPDPGPPGDDR
jgi:hypothetical protein